MSACTGTKSQIAEDDFLGKQLPAPFDQWYADWRTANPTALAVDSPNDALNNALSYDAYNNPWKPGSSVWPQDPGDTALVFFETLGGAFSVGKKKSAACKQNLPSDFSNPSKKKDAASAKAMCSRVWSAMGDPGCSSTGCKNCVSETTKLDTKGQESGNIWAMASDSSALQTWKDIITDCDKSSKQQYYQLSAAQCRRMRVAQIEQVWGAQGAYSQYADPHHREMAEELNMLAQYSNSDQAAKEAAAALGTVDSLSKEDLYAQAAQMCIAEKQQKNLSDKQYMSCMAAQDDTYRIIESNLYESADVWDRAMGKAYADARVGWDKKAKFDYWGMKIYYYAPLVGVAAGGYAFFREISGARLGLTQSVATAGALGMAAYAVSLYATAFLFAHSRFDKIRGKTGSMLENVANLASNQLLVPVLGADMVDWLEGLSAGAVVGALSATAFLTLHVLENGPDQLIMGLRPAAMTFLGGWYLNNFVTCMLATDRNCNTLDCAAGKTLKDVLGKSVYKLLNSLSPVGRGALTGAAAAAFYDFGVTAGEFDEDNLLGILIGAAAGGASGLFLECWEVEGKLSAKTFSCMMNNVFQEVGADLGRILHWLFEAAWKGVIKGLPVVGEGLATGEDLISGNFTGAFDAAKKEVGNVVKGVENFFSHLF